mmetsp:Transcript_25576/g.61864  ORF Transcript_25576/g.61864 Transcript_25576/m.61864 type:complete len:404 (+) Transcript_25576:129-1340(+)
MWRRMLSSATSRGMGAKMTRKQYFKNHLYLLHKQDPERWTEHVLSRHFMVPLENIRGMLALQGMAAEALEEKGAVDLELHEFADEAEEYLDDEALGPAVEDAFRYRADELAFGDKAPIPPPPSSLHTMSPLQETRLLTTALFRFNGGDVGDGEAPTTRKLQRTLQKHVGTLTDLELLSLMSAVGGEQMATTWDGANHKKLLQGLLDVLSPSMPDSLKKGLAQGDFTLQKASSELPEAPVVELAHYVNFEETSDAKKRRLPSVSDDIHASKPVIDMKVQGTRPSTDPVLDLVTDIGPEPLAYLTQEQINRMRKVSRRDTADVLEKNLADRKLFMSTSRQERMQKTGDIVFTEIRKPKRGFLEVPRVWVAEKATGTIREATQEEFRRAKLRVKPPMLLSYLKRTL